MRRYVICVVCVCVCCSFDKSCRIFLDRNSGDIRKNPLFRSYVFSACLIRMSEKCVKNYEGSEVFPYLHTYKWPCHTFIDASRYQKTPRSGTNDSFLLPTVAGRRRRRRKIIIIVANSLSSSSWRPDNSCSCNRLHYKKGTLSIRNPDLL